MSGAQVLGCALPVFDLLRGHHPGILQPLRVQLEHPRVTGNGAICQRHSCRWLILLIVPVPARRAIQVSTVTASERLHVLLITGSTFLSGECMREWCAPSVTNDIDDDVSFVAHAVVGGD